MTIRLPTFLARRAAAAAVALAALAAGTAGASAATVTVAQGDTLSGIAARHGVSVASLVSANGLANADAIRAGATLTIPGSSSSSTSRSTSSSGGSSGGGSHRIASGETLSGIAARYGTSVSALASANGLRSPYTIVAGRTLTVPSGGGSSASRSTSSSASSGGGSHRIASGETLSGIAARYGTSVSALASSNGLRSPYTIVAGRTLTVPSGGRSSASSSTAPTGWVPVAGAGASVGDLVAERARAHGVDPALARAVAWQESGWNQSAVSNVGATGVMQLMPGTARWVGETVLGRPVNRHSVTDNVDAGVAYLAWLQRQTGGDTRTAVAAYYQGLTGVRTRGWFDDTKAYVKSVLSLRERM